MQTSFEQSPSQKLATFLLEVPLFKGLNTSQIQSLMPDFRKRPYRAGATIFAQGDIGTDMYVVFEGKVRIYKLTPSGNETTIDIFSIGDIVGELAAIDQLPRSASAEALGPCTLLQIAGTQLMRHVREMPDLAINLAGLLAGKLRWTAEFAETIAQYDARGRLLHILLLYKEHFGKKTGPNEYTLDIKLNQTDFASMVGARREWVNRILTDWRNSGLVDYRSDKIILLDLPRIISERDKRIEAYHQEPM